MPSEGLKGAKLEKQALAQRVKEAYDSIGLMVFGAQQEDFVEAILKAKHETG